MRTVSALIWLRWHLLINERKRNSVSVRDIWLIAIIVFLCLLSSGLGYSISIVLLNPVVVKPRISWLSLANNIFTAIALVVVIAKLLSSNDLSRQLDQKKLSFYPLNEAALFISDLFSELVDLWYIGFACIILGFMLGLNTLTASPVTTILLLLLVAVNVLIVHFMFHFLDEMVQFILVYLRKARYLVLTAAFLTACVFLAITYLDSDVILRSEAILFSSLIWMNKAVYAIHFTRDNRIVTYALSVGALVAGAYLILYLLIRKIRSKAMFGRPSPKAAPWRPAVLTTEKVLAFLPDQIASLVQKDIRYLARSRATQIPFLAELLWLIYVAFNFRNPEAGYFVVFFLSFFPLVFWDLYLNNYFGMEKTAFAFYLFAPIDSENVVLGKSLSFVIVRWPLWLASWIFVAMRYPLPILPLLIIAQCAVLGVSLTRANFNSLNSAYAVERNSRLTGSYGGRVSIMGSLGFIASFAVPVILSVLVWKLGDAVLTYAVISAVPLSSFILYFSNLRRLRTIFFHKGESVLMELKRS